MKLRPIASKSGVKISIICKTGLVYKYRKYNRRIGLVTGAALFLAIHLFLSMFVWCVDVEGNSKISKNEILASAQQYGLKSGTLKKGFDEIRASRSIAADFNGEITWLSINIKGSLAVIELREDDRIFNEAYDKPPCNIVADFDGVILSAETYSGDCVVKKGNAVKKGDLLISGIIENEDLSTTFYSAKGEITALHERDIRFSESTEKKLQTLETVKKSYNLGFFGICIPTAVIKPNEDQAVFSEKKTLNINGYNLPFYIEKVIVCKKKNVTVRSNIPALEEIQSRLNAETAKSTVVSKEEKITFSDNKLSFIGRYTLIDYIGEEKPILTKK